MTFELDVHEPVGVSARRIAHASLDDALAHLAAPDDWDTSVHEVRKHCKKLRALLRLVRGEIGRAVYERENACFRDAARRLAGARDSYVLIETLDGLTDHFSDGLAADAFAGLRGRLVEAYEQTRARLLDGQDVAGVVAAALGDARARIDAWPLDGDGFGAMYDGLQRVYRRGRRCFARAYETTRDEDLHEWRKRVKYLMYQVRVLRPVWPATMDAMEAALGDVADALGEAHDLAVLRQMVTSAPELCDTPASLAHLAGLVDRRRAALCAQARPLGARLYVETPDAFTDRVAAYWDAWKHAPEPGHPLPYGVRLAGTSA